MRLVPVVLALLLVAACVRQPPERDAPAPPDALRGVGIATLGAAPPPPSTAPPAPVPASAAGTFTATTTGAAVIGTGRTRITYRIEVENGIVWGTHKPWTPDEFARTVDGILAAPRGWTWSAQAPVTNADVKLSNASWSFQRVVGNNYSVRIRLATATTVDRVCGEGGLRTQGEFSCRVGKTIMINLKRWLQGGGGPGYPESVEEYRVGVVNHEVGHFLGFDHMKCPGPGQPAPVMQVQGTGLGDCVANVHPFTEAGVFVSGPWESS